LIPSSGVRTRAVANARSRAKRRIADATDRPVAILGCDASRCDLSAQMVGRQASPRVVKRRINAGRKFLVRRATMAASHRAALHSIGLPSGTASELAASSSGHHLRIIESRLQPLTATIEQKTVLLRYPKPCLPSKSEFSIFGCGRREIFHGESACTGPFANPTTSKAAFPTGPAVCRHERKSTSGARGVQAGAATATLQDWSRPSALS
jgi:hypothetical protein